MSARSLPVAARLSRKHLRFLRCLRDGFPPSFSKREAARLAERLEPAFVLVRGKTAKITSDGLAALKERGL